MEPITKWLRRSFSINKTIININGELFSESEAKISVMDRGFLYGDSVYEVTDTLDENPIFIEEHFDRLWSSANKIGMDISYLRSEIRFEIDKVIKHLKVKRAYIRIILTRGVGDLSLSTKDVQNNNLVIIGREIAENPSWWYSKGVEVIIANTRRTSKDTVDPSVKSGNYLNNVMAYNEAVKLGAFDAIMLNQAKEITEGTTSNIWMIKESTYITPPLKSGLLGGITRQKIIEILRQNNMKFEEEVITENELKDADEIFLSSSTKRIIPVVKVDDKLINNGTPGTHTKKIIKHYYELLGEKSP